MEVHCSFSSMGKGISPGEFLNVLQDLITLQGNIVMPSFPLSRKFKLCHGDQRLGILSKSKWLPEDHNDPTDMGVLADIFRLQKDVLTGLGKHRMSAWGYRAADIVKDLNVVLKNSGNALLIGVDIRRLTAMHLVEHLIPNHYWPRFFTPLNPDIEKIYPPDEYFIVTEALPKYHIGWLKVQRIAEERGFITRGTIGQAETMFFSISDIVEIYKNEIKRNLSGLFELG